MGDEKLREFLLYTNTLIDSMRDCLDKDPENPWRFISYKTYMRKYNILLAKVAAETEANGMLDFYDMDRVPSEFDSVGAHQKVMFESAYTNLSILKSFLENKLNLRHDEIKNLKDFLQANVRKVIFRVPEKEVEIQDSIEQLFVGRGLTKGIDYDRETGRVRVSIKESVPDFIFPRLGLAIEVKLSKDKSRSRAIVDEINADIMAYGTKYSSILIVVYDLGTIRDELEFKHDLEAADNVEVIIIKH